MDILNIYGEYGAVGRNGGKNPNYITDVSLIRGYGLNAFEGATIDSGSLSTMTVQAYGAEAGKSARVVCRSGATCDLTCKDNACNGLKYYCEPGAVECYIFPNGCMGDNAPKSIAGTLCPKVINGVFNMVQHTESNTNAETDLNEGQEENMEEDESITKDNTCDANVANGCEGETFTSGDAVCNALQSCKNGIGNNFGYIHCNAEQSCAESEWNNVRYAFCSGYQSCRDLVYDPEGVGDIVCGAKESCIDITSKQNAAGGQRLACHGSSSCIGSQFGAGTYAPTQCYGNRACYSSKIDANSSINLKIWIIYQYLQWKTNGF